MVVIEGKYRGRKLVALEGKDTRPTTQRVKEDMFNILNNYFIFENKVSLDIFGGSGALTLEGLSRGIKYAIINDCNKQALEIIKKNLKKIESSEFIIYNYDYSFLLQKLKNDGTKVDLIYLDPPFAHLDYYYNFFNYIKENSILRNYGVIVTESETQLDLSKLSFLTLLKSKTYKNKFLYVFRQREEIINDQ